MSLPNLLGTVGQYFQNLGLPGVCLGPEMTVKKDQIVDQVNFNFAELPNCPLTLVVVSFRRSGQFISDFVEGYNFIIIDRTNKIIEKINPLSPTLDDFSPAALAQIGLGGYQYFVLRPEELPRIPDYFFLTLFYLETRLRSPQASRSDVLRQLQKITPQIIQNYRNRLLNFIPQLPPGNKGLVLCSGKDDLETLSLARYFPKRDYQWQTLDNKFETEPSIVGNFNDFGILQRIGLFSQDAIVIGRCPVGLSPIDYQNTIRAARWIVKNGGEISAVNYFWRLNESQMKAELERIVREEYLAGYRLIGKSNVLFTS